MNIKRIKLKALIYVMGLGQMLSLSSCNEQIRVAEVFSAPFKEAAIPQQKFQVSATDDAVIELPSVGSLTIPANCFVDEKGTPIEGEVDIAVKEIHNAADVIAYGIPMHHSRDGEDGVLSTAGMIDVRGTQNGKEIYIAPQKEIEVKIVNPVVNENVELFYFDELTKTWQEKEGLTVALQDKDGKIFSPDSLKNLVKMPNKPAQFVEGEPVFELDFRKVNIDNSLSAFLWKYTGDSKENNPINNMSFTKNNYSLKSAKIIDENTFTISATLKVIEDGRSKEITTTLSPILSGKALEKAMNVYNRQKREADSTLKFLSDVRMNKSFSLFSYRISTFGIHNCDVFARFGISSKNVEFTFMKDNQRIINDYCIYLLYDFAALDISPSPATIFAAESFNCTYLPDRTSFIVVINDQEAVHFSEESLSEAIKNKKAVLHLDVITKITSMDDLSELIKG